MANVMAVPPLSGWLTRRKKWQVNIDRFFELQPIAIIFLKCLHLGLTFPEEL